MKHEPRPDIHMAKCLGWSHKLCGAESQGISRVGQTLLARLTETQTWHSLRALQREGSERGQWPLLALMPDTSVSAYMPLGAF